MVLPTPPSLSPQATFRVPGPDDSVASVLDRWSNTHLALPAAVAVPHTEADIAALLAYAKTHNLTVQPAAGTHGAFVPVTAQTLYLDLRRLDAVRVDAAARTVTVGGGAVTGPVLRALAQAGLYACLPNSNAVGVVGAFLGGGGGALNGVHGFLVDHAVAARVVVPGSGRTLELGPHSTGDEAALWHALRGAGHGLAVVAELTLRVFPAADLALQDGDKVWQRRAVFPAGAVAVAARAFEKMQPVRGPISAVLLFARSPPGSPAPGAPIVVLSASYFGPADAAESALAPLFADEVVAAAVVAATAPVGLGALNDATAAFDAHGGFKALDSVFVGGASAGVVERAFARFVRLGASAPDTLPTAVVFGAWDTRVPVQNGGTADGRAAFFEHRDVGVCVYHFAWWTEEASSAAVAEYIRDATAIVREGETGPRRRFANNLAFPAALRETYSEGKLAELRRVKQVWDPEGVLWSPGARV